MNVTPSQALPAHLTVVATLAHVLQKLMRNGDLIQGAVMAVRFGVGAGLWVRIPILTVLLSGSES